MAAELSRHGERRSRNWDLGKEIKSRLPPIHYSAPLGIIGASRTGRKTLAARFAAMNADVPPQEDSKLFVNSFHVMTDGSDDCPQTVWVHLKAFICPPPRIGGLLIPISDIEDLVHFCCFIFLFDVSRRSTFEIAKVYMDRYSNVTTNFLVGNKCDLRLSVPQDLTVSREAIDEEAQSRGMTYYECSATTKENVQTLLDAIQDCALQDKYRMSL